MPIVGAFMVPHPPMIVPGVGRGREEDVLNTIHSYQEIASEIERLKPDTIIICSPHAPYGDDYFMISFGSSATGDFSEFGDSNDSFCVEYDEELSKNIFNVCHNHSFPIQWMMENDSLDHGSMVPLYFINQKYTSYKLVRVGLSNLTFPDHYQFGKIIQESISDDKRVVFIASGDLSHKLQEYGPYGFVEEGPVYDQKIIDYCSNGSFDQLLKMDVNFCDKAAECGHRSFLIMCGSFDGYDVTSNFYSHEDVTGVGYGIFSFYPNGYDSRRCFLDTYLEEEKKRIIDKRENGDSYVKLAYQSIDSFILNHETLLKPSNLDSELLNNRSGVFVSIMKFGCLRGCIGTFIPITRCIADEIIDNAISAVSRDFRFTPVREEELPYLEVHVDVLSEPEDITSIDELDPKKYGVIVYSGDKRGLLLPDLEGIDSVEDQITIAKRKAGITFDEEISLQRFEVVRHI